jgi:hypothetical protein
MTLGSLAISDKLANGTTAQSVRCAAIVTILFRSIFRVLYKFVGTLWSVDVASLFIYFLCFVTRRENFCVWVLSGREIRSMLASSSVQVFSFTAPNLKLSLWSFQSLQLAWRFNVDAHVDLYNTFDQFEDMYGDVELFILHLRFLISLLHPRA